MFAAMLVAFSGAISVATTALAYEQQSNYTQPSEYSQNTELSETQMQQVAEKKAEFKSKIETVKSERIEKLATKNLEKCEKRQERINKLVEKSTERSTKHLAVFQKIEDKVKAFYVKKNLTVVGYELAVANADAKEAAAIAAIETSNEVTFDCASTDAAKPGAEIKAAMETRHAALKDYRTAIKDLILVVKQHNGQNRDRSDNAASGTREETESTRMEQ